MNRVLVTILGDYLGKIVNLEPVDNNKIRVILNKLYIYEAIPVTRVGIGLLIRKWRELLQKSDEYGGKVFLVLADSKYDQKIINNDDILPILYPDASALIVLRDRKWEKLPYEAIGLSSPEEVELVSTWYTRYNAIINTYKYMLYEVDRYRNLLIRYAEYSKKLHERLVELERLVTELMKKSVDFQSEVQSMYATIRSLENYISVKDKESNLFKEAYTKLLERVHNLLDLSPRIVELINKLATFELSKEVEESILTTEISKLEKEAVKTSADISLIKDEINKIKEVISRKENIKEPQVREVKETQEIEETENEEEETSSEEEPYI